MGLVTTQNSAVERTGFSLTGALEEVAQQGEAQATELKEKITVLNAVQAALSALEKSSEAVVLELKSTEGQLHGVLCEIEQTQSRTELLEPQSQNIYLENLKLRVAIEDQEENARFLLAGYNAYRNKMESHKASVSVEESQTAVYSELLEKRNVVRKLREKREELRADLQNPQGNAVRQVQKELDDLKGDMSAVRETEREKTVLLLKEREHHSQLRKDIEIQNRRCEAIVKRLHCQLNKAQSSHRHLSRDICHMEKEVEDLKRRLEASLST